MRVFSTVTALVAILTVASFAHGDTILFRNGAVLEGKMLSSDDTHVRFESNGIVGNYSRKDVVAIDIGTLNETAIPDPEPGDLDVPTPWQEGDPASEEMEVPEVEPEQQSDEAPPSQPMEDECGEAPTVQHVWVHGYWWWNTGYYWWVPGYWHVPPYTAYVFIPGYWTFWHGHWVYVRGGWGHPYDGVIVMYAGPRPVVVVHSHTAPTRITPRKTTWRNHNFRHSGHAAYKKSGGSKNPKFRKRKGSPTVIDRYKKRQGLKKRTKPTKRRRATSPVTPSRKASSAKKPSQSRGKTSAPKVKRSVRKSKSRGKSSRSSGFRPSRSSKPSSTPKRRK